MSLDKPNPGQLKALWILMTAQSWGGALGAIAEGEPEVVKLIGDHDKEVAKQASAKAWEEAADYRDTGVGTLQEQFRARAAAIRRGEV